MKSKQQPGAWRQLAWNARPSCVGASRSRLVMACLLLAFAVPRLSAQYQFPFQLAGQQRSPFPGPQRGEEDLAAFHSDPMGVSQGCKSHSNIEPKANYIHAGQINFVMRQSRGLESRLKPAQRSKILRYSLVPTPRGLKPGLQTPPSLRHYSNSFPGCLTICRPGLAQKACQWFSRQDICPEASDSGAIRKPFARCGGVQCFRAVGECSPTTGLSPMAKS